MLWPTAKGEEADWIDLGTVQGYRRMVLCEAVLDELKLNLRSSDNDSDALARRTLEGMCRNRLALTTWLNKVFFKAMWQGALILVPFHVELQV